MLLLRKNILFIVFALSMNNVFGTHMTGGNIMYEYVGPGAGESKIYKITLILYKDNTCATCPGLPLWAQLVIVKNHDNALLRRDYVQLSSSETVFINYPFCIDNSPYLGYTLNKYSYVVDLPNISQGLSVSFRYCCRPDLTNVIPGSASTNSLTYFANIPPVNLLFPASLNDNSPVFKTDVPVICANHLFSYDFSALDRDNDSLSYSFTNAFLSERADTFDTERPLRFSVPTQPYTSVKYAPGFSGTSPLGPGVTINSNGIISGIAPAPGKYLVSVLVKSFVIHPSIPPQYPPPIAFFSGTKDFVITVAECDVPGVFFKPGGYVNCKDSTVTFENLNVSNLNSTFDWDFGDPASGSLNNSTLPNPAHTFSASGTYTVKLVVNSGTTCADSATTTAKVYPVFYPGFTVPSPQCVNVPLQFTDTSTSTYGTVNNWLWNFDDAPSFNDNSTAKNPAYTFKNVGLHNVSLIVGTSNGCKDTVTKTVSIINKMKLTIPADTLICSIDTLQLKVDTTGFGTTGSITWLPNYRIDDIHSFFPRVNPPVTTTYYAVFSNNIGCEVTDSIKVNVVDFVTLQPRSDTTICTSDPVKLEIVSDGLHYVWTPATDLDNPFIKNPVATPRQSRIYHVIATIGGCMAESDISIKAVDYPKANAGPDTSICLGTSAYLNASGGIYYSWTPAAFLSAVNIANPVSVIPENSVRYIVTVRDTLGCPKPVKDTLIVRVINIKADAGPRDTVVVAGQPLQLQATGAVNFSWTPATWLSNPVIGNPVALPEDDINYIVTATDAYGCYSTDSISIKLYKVSAGLYTPNAFSPNGDGLNDFFRPVSLGMNFLKTFRVYNRSGQLVYSGAGNSKGWDGKLKGIPQSPATYVWYAEGIDYLDKKIQRKGYVVLIR